MNIGWDFAIDPEMIRFYIKWLKEVLGIMNEDIILRLTLNQSYELKSDEILDYWKKLPKFQEVNSQKLFIKNSMEKQYNNDNYYGVLRVHVKESLDSLILMRGWIDGLKLSVGK